MKINHDPALLKRIALTTLRPCPPMRKVSVYVIDRTGRENSMGGACPHEPYHIEPRGMAYVDPVNGSTYGKRFASEHAGRRRWVYLQLREAVRFLRDLRTMPPLEVAAQRRYWLKERPAAAA